MRLENTGKQLLFAVCVVCDPDCWPAFNLGNCWLKEEYQAAIWAYEQAVRNPTEYAPFPEPGDCSLS